MLFFHVLPLGSSLGLRLRHIRHHVFARCCLFQCFLGGFFETFPGLGGTGDYFNFFGILSLQQLFFILVF